MYIWKYRNVIYYSVISISLLFLMACGGSSGGRDDTLVGTWIADRILGDTDSDSDDSTLIYNDDGTVEITAENQILNGTWDTEDDTIITTLPEYELTFSSEYSVSNDDNILTTQTVSAAGSTITEIYFRLTDNFPSELIGTWVPVAKTVFGATVSITAEPNLVLAEDGTGSVRWSVTEDRLLTLNPTTLAGLAFEYTISTAGTVKALVLTEDDDNGATVITYQLQ